MTTPTIERGKLPRGSRLFGLLIGLGHVLLIIAMSALILWGGLLENEQMQNDMMHDEASHGYAD